MSTQAATNGHILVTGATSGIGQAVALRLSENFPLVVHGRTMQKITSTLERCSARHPHIGWCCDLAAVDAIAESLRQCLREHAIHVRAIIHSAGTVLILPAKSHQPEAIGNAFAVNFTAGITLISQLVKNTVNGNELRDIIFISSLRCRFGAPGYALYGASKAALEGYMVNLAVELAPQVRVNTIQPGGVETPMAAGALRDASEAAQVSSAYPLGLGAAEDVAAAVEFLLSPNARWITGQCLTLDGGRSINLQKG